MVALRVPIIAQTDYQGLTLPRGGNALVATDLSTHDTLFSWKLGAVYKPTLQIAAFTLRMQNH